MALTAAQMAQLKQQLQSRRLELKGLVHDSLTAAGHERLAGEVQDRGEESLTDLLVDVDLALGAMDLQELREVEVALARLERGGYGECVGCGVEIPLARLQIQPAAVRCIKCQTLREQ